jgi:hypothetical protein
MSILIFYLFFVHAKTSETGGFDFTIPVVSKKFVIFDTGGFDFTIPVVSTVKARKITKKPSETSDTGGFDFRKPNSNVKVKVNSKVNSNNNIKVRGFPEMRFLPKPLFSHFKNGNPKSFQP